MTSVAHANASLACLLALPAVVCVGTCTPTTALSMYLPVWSFGGRGGVVLMLRVEYALADVVHVVAVIDALVQLRLGQLTILEDG